MYKFFIQTPSVVCLVSWGPCGVLVYAGLVMHARRPKDWHIKVRSTDRYGYKLTP